jgi:hypothetical protein
LITAITPGRRFGLLAGTVTVGIASALLFGGAVATCSIARATGP